MLPELEDWLKKSRVFKWHKHAIRFWTAGNPANAAKPVLLLLHGFPSAQFDWRYMWDDLADRFTLIAADMIGYGLSAKPPDYPYSLSDQADVVWALLDQLGAGNVHILAHDVGDTVAQELLARQKGSKGGRRVRSCVLLNGGLFAESHRPVKTQKLLLGRFGPLAARLMGKKRLGRSMAAIFGSRHRITEDEIQAFWDLLEFNEGRRVLPRTIRYLNERIEFRERWVGALVAAPCPLRFIVGTDDPVSGSHMAERYCELIPNPDVVLLRGIGHYPQIEDPAAVLAAVRAFHKTI